MRKCKNCGRIIDNYEWQYPMELCLECYYNDKDARDASIWPQESINMNPEMDNPGAGESSGGGSAQQGQGNKPAISKDEKIIFEMNAICEESLPPETFEKWQEIKAMLYEIRRDIKKVHINERI